MISQGSNIKFCYNYWQKLLCDREGFSAPQENHKHWKLYGWKSYTSDSKLGLETDDLICSNHLIGSTVYKRNELRLPRLQIKSST